MKKITYYIALVIGLALVFSCSKDDDKRAGKPVLDIQTTFSSAYFADSLEFAVKVSDADNVPLSTLKTQLFYGDDMVQEVILRTKEYGEYSGKIYVPFYVEIPDAEATLKIVLQNINFTTVEQEFPINLSRPDYPSIKLVVSGGSEYTMARDSKNQYSVTDNFSNKVPAFVVLPPFGANGNELTFGWSSGKVVLGAESPIPFSSYTAGNYPISFNTKSYAVAPMIVVKINGKELTMIDDDRSSADLAITQGQQIEFDGFIDISTWWLDPSYFDTSSGEVKFRAINGNYKITANFLLEYFRVEAVDASGAPLVLQADGSGAIWIIGNDVGMPSWSLNEVAWSPNNALCMAPMGGKKYEIILTAGPDADAPIGQSVKASSINFKFFYQRGWDSEFKHTALSTTSDMIFVGDGSDETAEKPKRDSGNLGVYITNPMTVGISYLFRVDVSAGNSAAVLTVEQLP